jgi:glycosyltransferase involved in cell wall biosynthesis
LTADLGLSGDVSFLGFRQDTAELLRAADVVLLPSTNEGLPLVILEAQAAGVPVIAAPTAGIPEIIEDGKTGFLVKADDAVGYAARIELLMRQPDTYGSMARNAMTRCRREYSWDAFQRRIDELYCELLAG